MKKSIRVLFLLAVAVCGTALFSSCITFALINAMTMMVSKSSAAAPATEYIPAVDTTYWWAQAEPRFLPESQVTERLADGSAWTRLSNNPAEKSFYGKTLEGKPVILDIAPGAVIHNLRDVFCEYAVSFRALDMPEDVRQFLQEYKTAEGITYYEYVVSHTDRIFLCPYITGNVRGMANYWNNNYPGERLIRMDNSTYDLRMAAGFVGFLIVLIHEAGHLHRRDLEKANIISWPLASKSGITTSFGNAVDERFAYLQEMAFAKTLREHTVELENYKTNSGIKRRIDSEIRRLVRWCAGNIAEANRALGLPVGNYELFPQEIYGVQRKLDVVRKPRAGTSIDVVRKPRAGASIAATFNTTGAAAAFNAVHAYLQSKTAAQVESEGLIQPGDYIDLPAITVAGTTVTDQPITMNKAPFEGYEGRLLRLIVVGINSFNGKNGNGTSAHLVFQFQNAAFDHNMNPETEKDTDGTNKGGYRDSAMRAYITGDFLPALIAAGVPEGVLWGPKRFVWNGKGARNAAAITDKLWLPTEWEMFGSNKYSSSAYETEKNQARFAYYDDNDVRLKYNSSNSAWMYWLASISYINSAYNDATFTYVTYGGITSHGYARFASGCAPAFCVR